MPQKWNLSSSVKCIFRKTEANRILAKQCSVFIVNFNDSVIRNCGLWSLSVIYKA